jgi:hypothetical protein
MKKVNISTLTATFSNKNFIIVIMQQKFDKQTANAALSQ